MRRLPRTAALAALLSLLAVSAAAGPADAADPLADLLRQKGLAIVEAPSVDAGQPEPVAGEDAPASMLARVRNGASDLVLQAMAHVGLRYRRGGTSAETGFDCSGFVRHVYGATFGLLLPRSADAQAASARVIDRADLRPGDLVFFNTMRRTFSHVGIYIGDNRFIHSPRTGEEVRTESMASAYWARRFTGARRVVDLAAPARQPSS